MQRPLTTESLQTVEEVDGGFISHSGKLLCFGQTPKICNRCMISVHFLTVGPILLIIS